MSEDPTARRLAQLAYNLASQFSNGGEGGGTVPATIEFFAVADGAQTVVVPTRRAALFIQGQRQPSANFTIANGVLTIPAETGVMAGNFIIIEPK